MKQIQPRDKVKARNGRELDLDRQKGKGTCRIEDGIWPPFNAEWERTSRGDRPSLYLKEWKPLKKREKRAASDEEKGAQHPRDENLTDEREMS